MTERENYLLVMEGKKPEWVPNYDDAIDIYIPAILMAHFMTPEMVDYFSVPWTIVDAGPMVNTHVPPVMEDICDWRKFVHFPNPDEFDWEGTAKMIMANHDPDKSVQIMPNFGGGTIFMPLMNMMGFENGLCALLEDPDECKEFFEYVTDYYVKLVPYIVKYYQPDSIIVGDDLCSANSAFISMNAFDEILKDCYQRQIDAVHAAGVKAELHMCGKCEPFVEAFAEMGVESWQPAQGSNDLRKIKERYGNKLVLVGTWATGGPAWAPGAPESLVRSELHRCMDELAVGGGMVFWTGGQVGNSEDQIARSTWVNEEARSYGRQFYKK